MIVCVINRIFSVRTCNILIQRYCASNVLKLNERGLLQDIFPPPRYEPVDFLVSVGNLYYFCLSI